MTHVVLDRIAEAILPNLEAQAAAEATRNFVGTYVSTDSNLNSSLQITFNESTVEGTSSGLSVSCWISNGTDVLASDLFAGIKPRLLPSIPNQSKENGKVAFQASTNSQFNSYTLAGDLGLGPLSGFYATKFDWLTVDERHYAGFGVNLFVFDVNEDGNATAVSPAVTRATLERLT